MKEVENQIEWPRERALGIFVILCYVIVVRRRE